MSADLLREAAAKLRESAEAATPGPWECDDRAVVNDLHLGSIRTPVLRPLGTYGPKVEDTRYIALVHPAVGLALADWLAECARLWEYGDGVGGARGRGCVMGWAVGFDYDHDRFRGYGVPAYCDAKGCGKEIDRGLGFVCEGMWCHGEGEGGCIDLDPVEVTTFVCGEHECADVDWDDMPPEHPDWVAHVLSDPSWAEWRKTNPEKVAALKEVGA